VITTTRYPQGHLDSCLQPNHKSLRPTGQKRGQDPNVLDRLAMSVYSIGPLKSGKPEHACSKLWACSTYLLEERGKTWDLNWDAAVRARASSGSSSSTKSPSVSLTISLPGPSCTDSISFLIPLWWEWSQLQRVLHEASGNWSNTDSTST